MVISIMEKAVLKGKTKIFFLTLLIYAYPLFILKSIKYKYSFTIDGFITSNELWLIPLLVLIKVLISKKNAIDFKCLIITLLLISYCIFSIIFIGSSSQSVYSLYIATMPLALVIIRNKTDGTLFYHYLKAVIIFAGLYGLLVVGQFFTHNLIARVTGHAELAASYVTRYPTMFGSSITTSYYLILSIPIIIIGVLKFDSIWKKISIISLSASSLAVILAQSRICFIVLIIYTAVFLFHYNQKLSIFKKSVVVLLLVLLAYYIINNPFLNRLSSHYFEGASSSSRFNALHVGLVLFEHKPVMGSGIAVFYKRLWEDNHISIMGLDTLVDPHNLYIFLLDEIGIIGFVLLASLFVYLVKNIINRLESIEKFSFIMMLVGILICFFAGSQPINEVSFAVVFWWYISFFYSKASLNQRDINNENIIFRL